MSSFQSFKSFVRIQQNNTSLANAQANLVGQQKCSKNQSLDRFKDQNNLFAQQNQTKSLKRIKKPGTVCNFISKVYSMLEEKQIHHVVCWIQKPLLNTPLDQKLSLNSQKKEEFNQLCQTQSIYHSFQILDVTKFESIVLPKYFKHSNLSSFVRQLNMYGFHKLRGQKDDYQFQHQKFQKNKKQLLPQIRRKSPEFIGISATNIEESLQRNFLNKSKQTSQINILSSHHLPFSQQEIVIWKEQLGENNIFPSQKFLNNQKYKQNLARQRQNLARQKVIEESQISFQQQKMKKIQRLEEQNSLLKQIKQRQMLKVKQLSSGNKSNLEIKFSKMVFSFFSHKIKEEYSNCNYNQIKQIQCSQTEKTKGRISITELVDHVLNNQEANKIRQYAGKVKQYLIQRNQ